MEENMELEEKTYIRDARLLEIAKIKYVFFDIDGVLSIPRYKNFLTGKIVSGFSDEEWLKYDIFSQHPYEYCIAPKIMKELVNIMHNNRGICKRCFGLTADTNSFSYNSKKRFIKDNYPEINTEDIILVSSADMKVDVIKYIAERDGINLKECLLIEDTFQTIINTELAGICNLHISEASELLSDIKEYQINTRPRNNDLLIDMTGRLF